MTIVSSNLVPTTAPRDASGSATLDESKSVLSTLNDDGSRRWIHPRPSPGRFLSARRWVAYGLIALFVALPLIHVDGRPLVLLDIVYRRFYLFGSTFYPTDTLLLGLMLLGVFITIFWLTALLGRVWCGWGCPQTVYMEFVYRPIERFFQGTPGRAGKGWLQTSGAGKVLKYPVYAAISLALAHTFLAYFVGWERLQHWVFGSPLEHSAGFIVVMLVTAGMMFDFAYFREQVCLVACPYGRMQSVLLDRQSMIIRYDERRGEPRGKKVAKASPAADATSAPGDISLPIAQAAKDRGDCIDCHMCVVTCPTGIDIRNGLQMECIGCAQCIDACDTVMDKIGRPRGLIRYATEATMRGEKFRLWRPRTVLYPVVLGVIATAFVLVLAGTGIADITVLRGQGRPFAVTPEGEVENNVRVKIVNRLPEPATYTLGLDGPAGARLATEKASVHVGPGEMVTTPAQIFVPAGAVKDGKAGVFITITGPDGFAKRVPFGFLGPVAGVQTPAQPPATAPGDGAAGGAE